MFRVRAVEWPLEPYLQWELHLLQIRAEYGEQIHTVSLQQIQEFEDREPLPELLTVGLDTVYQLLYDRQGLIQGAIRFVGSELTALCVEFIKDLYNSGEDLSTFFQREVAHLEPPKQT